MSAPLYTPVYTPILLLRMSVFMAGGLTQALTLQNAMIARKCLTPCFQMPPALCQDPEGNTPRLLKRVRISSKRDSDGTPSPGRRWPRRVTTA